MMGKIAYIVRTMMVMAPIIKFKPNSTGVKKVPIAAQRCRVESCLHLLSYMFQHWFGVLPVLK